MGGARRRFRFSTGLYIDGVRHTTAAKVMAPQARDVALYWHGSFVIQLSLRLGKRFYFSLRPIATGKVGTAHVEFRIKDSHASRSWRAGSKTDDTHALSHRHGRTGIKDGNSLKCHSRRNSVHTPALSAQRNKTGQWASPVAGF